MSLTDAVLDLPVQSKETDSLLAEDTSVASHVKCRKQSPRIWAVAYVCVAAVQGFLILGFAQGFTSPVLSELEDEKKNDISLRRTTYKDCFIISFLVGAAVVAPFGGYLSDYFGRKLSIIFCSVPFAIGWLLIILTLVTDGPAFRPLLYSGRFVVGLAAGWSSVCNIAYPTEVAPQNLRGAFVALNQLALNSGTFLGQIIGVYLPYYWLAVIPLAISVSFAVLSTTIVETPRWLMTQGKQQEAFEVLRWLRGPNYDVYQEIKDIELIVLSQKKLTLPEIIREFKNRSVYYPVMLSLIIMLFVQLCGITAISYHAEDIFRQANIKSPGLTSSCATGGAQVVAAIIGMLLSDVVGRRKLMIVSGIIMCLSHGAMGAYEYLNNKPYCHPPDDPNCKDHLYPLAIASIACFVLSFSAGTLSVAWVVAAELLPLRVRGVAMGLNAFVTWISILLVAGLYNNYEAVMKPWGVFWAFSVMCFCLVVFVAVFIPETKGRSLEDIESSVMKRAQR